MLAAMPPYRMYWAFALAAVWGCTPASLPPKKSEVGSEGASIASEKRRARRGPGCEDPAVERALRSATQVGWVEDFEGEPTCVVWTLSRIEQGGLELASERAAGAKTLMESHLAEVSESCVWLQNHTVTLRDASTGVADQGIMDGCVTNLTGGKLMDGRVEFSGGRQWYFDLDACRKAAAETQGYARRPGC